MEKHIWVEEEKQKIEDEEKTKIQEIITEKEEKMFLWKLTYENENSETMVTENATNDGSMSDSDSSSVELKANIVDL
ncbi:MAG: hypothetical protein GY874_11820 [Desulfobacteraceae bacterium]|nr:hypothetical protein [Desulfobacteraceae bacterium]